MTTHTDILLGRTAVVTGGARGLGYAMAKALAQHGAAIALLDRLGSVQDAAATISSDVGAAAVGLEVDVTDPTSVDRALTTVAEDLGAPTILINSAGVGLGVPALDITLEQWDRLMSVNVTGTLLMSQGFARRAVRANEKATIVNVSSMSGFIVNVPQAQAAYNASKAAVAMLTKSLAIEWLPLGVRVNAIAPGYFASDMTRDFVANNPEMAEAWISRIPVGRMGNPEELGRLAVYLASEESSYIVGQNIIIDGGYTLI